MYKLCKTEQSAARQRQLEQGLLQAMLTTPYDDITISDLCQQMNIPRKAFYRYFSSKESALFALLDHTLMDFSGSDLHIGKNPASTDLKNFFLFWYENRQLLDALERSHLSGIIIQRAILFAQQEKLVPRLIVSWSADLQGTAMAFAISGLMAMVIHWHDQDFCISVEDMTRVATVMLSSPLLPK